MTELIIDTKNKDQRFSKYLERLLCGTGSGFLYRMLRKKNITLNGRKATGSETLKEGDVVRLYFSDETFEKLTQPLQKTDAPPLPQDRIVYEDENILIFNKPAGMLSQQSERGEISACEHLVSYLEKKGETDRSYRPSFVNRLDRNTSGLLLGAKNLPAAQALSEMIREGKIKKEYQTLVKGRVCGAAEETAYLRKDYSANKVTVSADPARGDRIETAYTPLRFCDKLNAALLQVELRTGKTHQIRAHLAFLGHPVAGDAKYGDPKWNARLKKEYGIGHQLLHSFRVTFPENDGVLGGLSNRSFEAAPPFAGLYEE